MDQPGKIANPARGQLNRETGKINVFMSPFGPENLISRDDSAVLSRVSLLILHTQIESGILPLYNTLATGRIKTLRRCYEDHIIINVACRGDT